MMWQSDLELCIFFHVKNRGWGRCIDVTDCFCRTVGGSLMPYLVFTPVWSNTVQERCMGSGTVLGYKASKLFAAADKN